MKASLIFAVASACFAAAALPVTPAESLSGQKLMFPTALAGKPAVCVFGFTKEAGDKTTAWMSRLNDAGIQAWSIAELESAPALVRGMIRGSMRKGTPAALLDRSLVFTKDTKAWKTALAVKQESVPVVVVLDSAGQVIWTYEGVFSEGALHQVSERALNREAIDGGGVKVFAGPQNR